MIDNWIDPIGAYFCSNASRGAKIGTLNQSGNVNLLDGSAIVGLHGFGPGEVCHGHVF